MSLSTLEEINSRLLRLLGESAQRRSAAHRQFLQVRQDSLGDLRSLIELQVQSTLGVNHAAVQRQALFDSRQLDEFGTGSMSGCFGPAYARYDGRRIPRIPNGDLKMMSRVVSITGSPREFHQPASILVEYDVPVDAWYLRDTAYPHIPASLWMEIALQPCGFLSAYLDTYSLVPYGEFNFRNLDGSTRTVAEMDVRGKTIQTQASMLSSVAGGGTVVQKFAFEVSCQGQVLYTGESTFGYFSIETMANQVGLDGGRAVAPALRSDGQLGQTAYRVDTRPLRSAQLAKPFYHLPANQLSFLDEVTITPNAGKYHQGTIYASRPVNPGDWFYPCHFYQDPVMPGSLGVEAILEAIQAYAMVNDLGSGMRSPRFGLASGGQPFSWRYRGQITPQHRLMELEVHLSGVERQPGQVTVRGDASLWVDGLRIYEVTNAAVAILE